MSSLAPPTSTAFYLLTSRSEAVSSTFFPRALPARRRLTSPPVTSRCRFERRADRQAAFHAGGGGGMLAPSNHSSGGWADECAVRRHGSLPGEEPDLPGA